MAPRPLSVDEAIVAPITAVGGAVAVVRVSGRGAWRVASGVFAPWPDPVVARRALYGRFVHGDDGLALPFAEGQSYTGEEAVELSVHGSPASVRALLEACRAAGARPAEPGEFTLRAFMNGRMDLTQAEAVRDTVEAQTDAQLRHANLLREGALRDRVRAVRDEAVGVLAAVEASTDFSEEVGDLDRPAARARLARARTRLAELLATADAGRLLRQGATIAIVGLPNAGKSSLLNAVVGAERAIVTPIPGTTRDTVEEVVEIGGLPCRLIDTAGLRETDDEVERLGVARSVQALASADLVWHVFDLGQGWTAEDQALTTDRPTLCIGNKADLPAAAGLLPEGALSVSALTGGGIEDLLRETARKFDHAASAGPTVAPRHSPVLAEADRALAGAEETLSQPVPDDLAAVELRQAVRLLGEVTGETTPPDVIERVFRDFCIGK